MYSYSQFPQYSNYNMSTSAQNMQPKFNPSMQMNPQYMPQRLNQTYSSNSQNIQSDDRFGFLGPFILGGITGGLLAPAFYNNNHGGGYGYYQQPMMYPYPMGPCCR